MRNLRGRDAIRYVKLPQDIRHVDADRLTADVELLGNALVAVAERELLEHFELARGQAEVGRDRRPPVVDRRSLGRNETDPRALRESLDLLAQRCRSHRAGRCPRPARSLGRPAARAPYRKDGLGFAPAAIRGGERLVRRVPNRRRALPQFGIRRVQP